MKYIEECLYLLILCKLVNVVLCIYTPYDKIITKPHLSPGIKTTNWKNSHSQNILMHHNYSHVNYQTPIAGNALTPSQIYESTTYRVYPVYRPDQILPIRHPNNASEDFVSQKVKIRRKKDLVVYDKCPPGVTGQLVYSLSCNQFLNCWKGRTFIQNCGPGTLFNPDTSSCDFPEKVQCLTGPRRTAYEIPTPASFSHTVNTRTTQPNCPKEFSGRMPNYSNCTKFVICMHGQAMSQICPPGTLFDINQNVCDHPNIAKCFNGQNQDLKQNVNYFVVKPTGIVTEGQFNQYTLFLPRTYETQYDQNNSGTRKDKQMNVNITCENLDGCPRPFATHPPVGSNFLIPKCEPNCENKEKLPQNNLNVRNPECFPPNCNDKQATNKPVLCDSANKNCVTKYTTNEYDNKNNDPTAASSNKVFSRCNPNTKNCRGLSHINNGQQVLTSHQGQTVIDLNRGCRGNNCDQLINGQYNPNLDYQRKQDNNNENIHTNVPTRGYQTTQHYPETNVDQTKTVQCPQGAMGVQAHPYDCSKFLNCANGQTFIQSCGPGTVFNSAILNCDFDYNVQCNQKRINNEITDNYITSTQRVISWTPNSENTEKKLTTTITYLTPVPNYVDTQRGHFITKPPKYYPNSDYDDVGPSKQGFATMKPIYPDQNLDFGNKRQIEPKIPQKGKTSPPPFLVTDPNADYVYEYFKVDNEAVIDPQNAKQEFEVDCRKGGFDCSNSQNYCISKSLVCDGKKDCTTGKDEIGCNKYLEKFEVKKNSRLAVAELERWDNTTVHSCAFLCLESKKFDCKSFHYRKDNCCLLLDKNEGMTGLLMAYQPNDYYELTSSKLNCSDMFKCNNNKCIKKNQICDGQSDCGDREDERNCPAEKIGYKVSLSGGNHTWEGRLEIQAFGKTGLVCDDNFDLRDADVVCRELGFKMGATEVKGSSYFAKDIPEENIFYMMDDIICQGNETSLRECNFNGWGSHDCTTQEVVGVICKSEQEQCPKSFWKCNTTNECVPLAFLCDGPEDCTDGSDENENVCEAPVLIRLMNGTTRSEGRLEVKYHGIWGSVCDDDFNDDAAKVICRSLGFLGSAVVKKDAYFGIGIGPIWLDQVSCFGNETALEDCSHWKWGEHNCDHSEDVGIICNSPVYGERHGNHLEGIKAAPLENHSSVPIYPASCGLRKDILLNSNSDVHFRVVQGSKARVGDYPWQAALRVKGKFRVAHWCGAVVISSKFVLTAAHCLVGYPKGAYVVVAGDYNIQEDEGTEQYVYIEDYYIHEDFRKGHKMNNDIALVKLKGDGLKLNSDVQAICLPDSDAKYDTDLNCTISGFGSIESGSSAFSNELRAAQVPLQPENVCKMPHVYGPHLTDGMICAGSLDGGVDACDGDSGGPLACLDKGLYTLYGLTSWGQRCGLANKPGVYVKVAYYRKWIDDTMKKHM